MYDLDCFYRADPNSFLVGLIDDEPKATISAVKYSKNFGFVGFYIVRSDFRGFGYGIEIWNAGLEYLTGRNIGLDGVIAQQDNYRKSGLKLAYSNIRYEGTGGGTFPGCKEIVHLSTIPIDDIIDYDKIFFSGDLPPLKLKRYQSLYCAYDLQITMPDTIFMISRRILCKNHALFRNTTPCYSIYLELIFHNVQDVIVS